MIQVGIKWILTENCMKLNQEGRRPSCPHWLHQCVPPPNIAYFQQKSKMGSVTFPLMQGTDTGRARLI